MLQGKKGIFFIYKCAHVILPMWYLAFCTLQMMLLKAWGVRATLSCSQPLPTYKWVLFLFFLSVVSSDTLFNLLFLCRFLQEDFDAFFTPSDYEDPDIRKQIQEHHITAYENTRGHHSTKAKVAATPVVANDADGKTKTISTEAGLRRLGRQLQRTEQELWSDLALRAMGVGKVGKALKILRFACVHSAACSLKCVGTFGEP